MLVQKLIAQIYFREEARLQGPIRTHLLHEAAENAEVVGRFSEAKMG